jgi:hypothetical protein
VARNTCSPTFTLRSNKEPKETDADLQPAPISANEILPRARQLGTERIQRGPRIVYDDK